MPTLNSNPLIPRHFYETKYKKKIAKEGTPGTLLLEELLKLVIFMTKQRFPRQILVGNLTAKTISEDNLP